MKRQLSNSFFALTFFILNLSAVLAQQDSVRSNDQELSNPWQLGWQRTQQGKNYLAVLSEFKQLEPQYLASILKQPFCEYMGTINSYVGNYLEALSSFDKFRPQNYYAPEFRSSLDNYKPYNALAIIQSIADSHQVIFINEAHHVPLHRAFSIRLLKMLYDKGFRYFAAETLIELDKELNRRKYPLQQITGGYTDEPVYGDLVRQALKSGFKVIPYEHFVPCNAFDDTTKNCQNQRERGQAQNLNDRILVADPTAKIFVHAGYGHISEKGGDQWIPMAKYFKEITGIDPFTIDQVLMTEHGSPEYEHVEYRYATKKDLVKEPTIFVSEHGELWVNEFDRGHYDVQVFHPRSHYKNERPDWLSLGGARKPYLLDKEYCKETLPCLIEAFIGGEDKNAVPIDRIVISDPKSIPALMLPKGTIRIVAVDETNNIINEITEDIK